MLRAGRYSGFGLPTVPAHTLMWRVRRVLSWRPSRRQIVAGLTLAAYLLAVSGVRLPAHAKGGATAPPSAKPVCGCCSMEGGCCCCAGPTCAPDQGEARPKRSSELTPPATAMCEIADQGREVRLAVLGSRGQQTRDLSIRAARPAVWSTARIPPTSHLRKVVPSGKNACQSPGREI